MRILAIDPGDKESGWCLMEGYKPVQFGKSPNEELLYVIGEYTMSIECLVVEMVASYGMAVGKNVFETCVWIGRFLQKYTDHGGDTAAYVYRMEEKMRLCHDSRAKDTNIRKALVDRFADHDKETGKGTKKDPDWFYGFRADSWMAYAVGVVFLDKKQEEILQR